MTAIDYAQVLARRRHGKRSNYDQDRVMLYALGVGLGNDPLDDRQLDYVYEKRLKVLPSFATVAAWDIGFTLELGVEWSKLIHAAQRLTLHQPLPTEAEIRCDTRTSAAFAKKRGTLLVNETKLYHHRTNTLLADLESVSLARDFVVTGAPEGSPPQDPAPPNREPDVVVDLPTSPQVALIYRLLGGRSAIHCDPSDARTQGFDGPIMHGLSTWGHACHAVIKGICDYESERLRSFAARFSAPVYPGETLRTRIWHGGNNDIQFETRALGRDVIVLANGSARCGAIS